MTIAPMWLRLSILTIVFFILAFLEASFLSYLSFWGVSLNLVFILFFILAFFTARNNFYQLIYFAVLAGFFLDIFSVLPFGVYIVSLIIISFFIKIMLNNLREGDDKYPIFYFVLLFLISFIFNELLLGLAFYFSNHLYPTSLNWSLIVAIAYNLFFATIGFYGFKQISGKK